MNWRLEDKIWKTSCLWTVWVREQEQRNQYKYFIPIGRYNVQKESLAHIDYYLKSNETKKRLQVSLLILLMCLARNFEDHHGKAIWRKWRSVIGSIEILLFGDLWTLRTLRQSTECWQQGRLIVTNIYIHTHAHTYIHSNSPLSFTYCHPFHSYRSYLFYLC